MSVEVFPEGEAEKKLGQAMEENASRSPEAYERAARRQHELEANTFGGPLAPGEAPSEMDIGPLPDDEKAVEKGKEQAN